MSDINTSDYVGRFEFVEFGSNVPEGDFARFVVTFIKMLLKSFQLENETFLPVNLEENLMHCTKWHH